MKRLILCVLFLVQCIFLFGGPQQIYFYLENKSNSEIVVSYTYNPEFFSEEGGRVTVRFLLKDGKETICESTNTYASETNRSLMPEDSTGFMNVIKNVKLLTLPPLEIFNTVIVSLCVTDASGNILLTEKDLTNDSFIKVGEERSINFILEIHDEK